MKIHQQRVDAPLLKPQAGEIFDVAVVGAGVVGCAMARRFTLEGARVAVLERAPDILDGASKANSAILHTGFDAPHGSLELACVRDGFREYIEIHREMGLPLEWSGAYVVAWTDDEVARLQDVLALAHQNGFSDLELIGAGELLRREPHLSGRALAAMAVPDEAIIDPWSAPYAYLGQALENGAEVFLACDVTGGSFEGDVWRLETSRGELTCRHVINCAGLYGDRLDQALLGTASFEIRPRKGQFVVFDKAASKLLTAVIFPVPTSRTKGVVVTRTVFGNVLVGPTAEDQLSRSDASTDEVTLRGLLAAAVEKFPALANIPITATYAGLRPATEQKDYRIEARSDRNWISVGGIRSTGLSSALGIARHVYGLYSQQGAKHHAIDDPKLPAMPVLSQSGERDWCRAGHGGIVCHCELVTEREISQALAGPLAARSLAGLKRQTRATMGRCQGFYCSARIAELTADRFETSLTVGAAHD